MNGFELTWNGKEEARQLAKSPIDFTTELVEEGSVDFATTGNLYIEGDNLDALKYLQKDYAGKVKMIYIDPPYNTGNNLIYKNNFNGTHADYSERRHANWCTLLLSRLILAYTLLRDDGYITIAIDDNELYNLKLITDEVFGEQNYVGTIVTRCNPSGRNKINIDPVHEYHLVYAKDIDKLPKLLLKRHGESKYCNLLRMGSNSRKHERPYRFFPILVKDGKVSTVTRDEYEKIYQKDKGFDEDHLKALREKYEALGFKFILPLSKTDERVWHRKYDRVVEECSQYVYESGHIKYLQDEKRTPYSLWSDNIYNNITYGTYRLKNMFGIAAAPFDYAKSIHTVRDLISLGTEGEDIILDFFSGSGTTAHATMLLNAEDGGRRKFILVQLPEPCDKMGCKNICEIGEDYVRRAGREILSAKPEVKHYLDTGFKILKIIK